MKIVYLGALLSERLEQAFLFDRPIRNIKRKYPFGTDLAIGLTSKGHHVSLVTLSMEVPQIERYSSEKCAVYIVPERRVRYQYPSLYAREIDLLKGVINQIKPDVILANWTYQYARAALVSGFPCLVVARDSPWRCALHMKRFSMWFKALYSQLFVLPRCKHLTTISPHMVEDLRKYNFYRRGVMVIPNGIPQPKLFVNDEGVCQKEVKKVAKTILCVSEWNTLKNTQTLMRAFAMLHQAHADWKIVFVGNYMDGLGAEAWAKKVGLCVDGMEFLGRKSPPEIQDLLRREADVFCSPTLEESFGQVFLEAMANGVPCVGGEKSGAVPWLLGDAGILCDVTNPKILANELESIMIDYEKRCRISKLGILRAKECFTIDKVIDDYEAALTKIAEAVQ